MFVTSTEGDKIRESTRICAVEVQNIRYEERKKNIVTVADVKPIQCMKDPVTTSFEVVWPGGVLKTKDAEGKEGVRQARVMGTPQLKAGQKVLLYLWKKDEAASFTVHGWSQGVVGLQWNEKTKVYDFEKPLTESQKTISNLKEFEALVEGVLSKTRKKF